MPNGEQTKIPRITRYFSLHGIIIDLGKLLHLSEEKSSVL